MPVVIPIVVAAAVTTATVSAGLVVAGGFGAAMVFSVASTVTSYAMTELGLMGKVAQEVANQTDTGPSAVGPSMTLSSSAFDVRTTLRTGIQAQNTIYGKTLVGGVIPFWFINGSRKQFHHYAQVLAGHEIDGIESYWIGDAQVAVDSSGFVTTKKYMRDTKKLIRFTVFDGTQTSLPSELVTASVNKLRSSDCATGMAWVYIRWEADYDVFGQIGIPDFRFEVRGKKLYDPRTGTTAYSTNPALATRDYLLTNLGLRCLASEVNDTDIIASANICDELVIKPDGTYQKRYEINGAISCQVGLKDNLDSIVLSMNGLIVWTQGKWSAQAGAYQTPVMTLTEEHIVSVENLVAFTPRRDIFNSITGTFFDASGGYIEKQYPLVKSNPLIELDGEQIERVINFPLVTDAIVAQRLAKIEIIRARQSVSITIVTNYKAYDLRPGSHVYMTVARYGWTNKVFVVMSRTLSDAGIQYGLRETSPAVWDWTQFDGITEGEEDNTDLPNPYEVPNVANLTAASGEEYLYVASDGTVLSRIKVSWNESDNQYVYSGGAVEIQYTTGASDWVSIKVDGEQSTSFISPVVDKKTYSIRARFVTGSGQRGAWTQITHTVVGKSAPPPNVTSFTIEKNILSWSPVVNTPDLAGYKIKFQYGQNTWWPTAKELHEGLITSSPYSPTVVPNGPITILIKSVDTSGNESVNPAVITQNTGDVIVNNLLESFVQHPLWLGTKTNCSVISGELYADDSNAFYLADDLPIYGFDADLFYRPTQSLPMSYEFSLIATKNSFIKIDYLLTTDNFKIEYRLPNQSIFYGIDTEKFYGADADLIFGGYQDWQMFAGQLAVDNQTEVQIKISTFGGVGQDIIKELTAIVDVDDIVVRLDDVVISSAGTRLNLGQKVNAIKNIQMTVQSDGNNGITARIIDKNASNGPLIQVLNSSGASVTGLIDAVIQAY